MRAAVRCRALSLLVAAGLVAACSGETPTPTGGTTTSPRPAAREAWPDPPPEVAEEVAAVVREWVAERTDEDGLFDIPPRGGHDVAGVLSELHPIHQNDADTYTVCVDFRSDDTTFDVDFFVDRTPEGLAVRGVFLHKINGEVVSG
jgi:hypothetical protein